MGGSGTEREGQLIIVVGPSGAGKDSIIDFARERFRGDRRVQFVRRIVTRAADQSAEDHETLTPERFAAAEAAGRFAFTWQAHGLSYGLPATMDAHLKAGGVAVANGSRATLARLIASYPRLIVASIEVDPAILAKRLAARGREDAREIADRLRRAERYEIAGDACVAIRNDGPLEDAGEALVALIRRSLAGAAADA